MIQQPTTTLQLNDKNIRLAVGLIENKISYNAEEGLANSLLELLIIVSRYPHVEIFLESFTKEFGVLLSCSENKALQAT